MKFAAGRHTWAEIEPYFDELLDTEPQVRETWLENLAQTSPSMAAALRDATLLLSGRIALAQGQPGQAESAVQEALSIAEKRARQPDLSADVGEALLVLAEAQRAGSNPAGARESVARAVVALSNSLSADHPLTTEAIALQ